MADERTIEQLKRACEAADAAVDDGWVRVKAAEAALAAARKASRAADAALVAAETRAELASQ
jgi:hypothetical protein